MRNKFPLFPEVTRFGEVTLEHQWTKNHTERQFTTVLVATFTIEEKL